MISRYTRVSLLNNSLGNISKEIVADNSFVLNYPCTNKIDCTPYVLKLSKGKYKFECWGAIGKQWEGRSKPGLGGYTSGTLFVPYPLNFYVYIGTTGLFNAVYGYDKEYGLSPGGATDVRLTPSNEWWDNKSLISRIMVAAGGGGAEWTYSVGGNGGGLVGDESIASKSADGIETYDPHCPGANQTSGSECETIFFENNYYSAAKGTFGSAGRSDVKQTPWGNETGGFGGGGYYGGTSYNFAWAGSGGSSFISGHEGCDAVKDKSDVIEHTGQPNHYSGYVFTDTEMIKGNQTMPLPSNPLTNGIHSGIGAFRLTILEFYPITSPSFINLSYFLMNNLSFFILS